MYERFTHQRCAFYWVPAPGSEEHRLLTPLLGRDILTGETVPQIVPEGLDPASWAAMTETAAHYGVHATLKAPFETKPGVTDDDLRDAGRRIAGRFSPIRTTPLELRYIPAGGGFLALTPAKTDAPLQALERACVSEPDSLRAPSARLTSPAAVPFRKHRPGICAPGATTSSSNFSVSTSRSRDPLRIRICSPVSRNGSPRISPPSRDGPSLSTPWPSAASRRGGIPLWLWNAFPLATTKQSGRQ